MDSNKSRVDAHRAMIASNISGSTQSSTPLIEKGEKISIGEFQDRLEKGESFLSEPQINKFIEDNQANITKAFSSEDKDSIKKSVDAELNLLIPVTVVNEFGKEFKFFSRKETTEDFLEKGKKANVGEIRQWKGSKQQKQSDGSWKPVSEGGKDKPKEEEGGSSKKMDLYPGEAKALLENTTFEEEPSGKFIGKVKDKFSGGKTKYLSQSGDSMSKDGYHDAGTFSKEQVDKLKSSWNRISKK